MDISWDDVRIFLAVYRGGSLSAAAKGLEVTRVTVGRRLAVLEEQVGPLFVRQNGRYVLSRLGEELLEGAELMDAGMGHVARTVRDVGGREPALRLTVPAAFEDAALQGLLPFISAHPDIVIDLDADRRLVDLHRHEADVALRVWRAGLAPGSADTVTKRIGRINWSFHAAEQIVRRSKLVPPLQSLGGLPFIRFGRNTPFVPGEDWLQRHPGEPTTVLWASSLTTVINAARRGAGIGAMPDLLGREAGLVSLTESIEQMDVWLAVRRGVSDTPAVRLLKAHLERMVAFWSDG